MDDTPDPALPVDTARIAIRRAQTALGIELGSTRIKAVLVGPDSRPLASGEHAWENRLVDGVWSYDLEDVWSGLRAAYADLVRDVERTWSEPLTTIGSIGISAMMHGYLATDADDRLLVPFRTWRNTSTGPASRALTRALGINIPLRWSVAHLYQAILDEEPHVSRVASLTTLSGLVHRRLTGRSVLGIGDASGMFPVDAATGDWDTDRLAAFDELVADRHLPWHLRSLLPAVLRAGDDAGILTAEGARLLDPTGTLQPGIPLCPPEGDAGTGMVATNAVSPRTGNVSAGTSIFAMVVLEHGLSRVHEELDLVSTPDGSPVAMVHGNNGTSELDAWADVFGEFAAAAGLAIDRSRVYEVLYHAADRAVPDASGVLAYNFLSGEPIAGLEGEGRPLVLRTPGSRLTLGTFMRAQLMTVFGALRLGMDILREDEGVRLDRLFGHGGLFKTAGVAQGLLAAALDTPVSVGATAGEGGPWGMALLALFRARREPGLSLPAWLDAEVFPGADITTMAPDPAAREGFQAFMARYRAGLPIARTAVHHS